MKRRHFLYILLTAAATLFLAGCKVVVFQPRGYIADREMHLFIDAIVLMLLVVIPVIILTFVIARRYRASNKKAKYTPNWSHSNILEVGWWLIPIIIIAILAVITWRTTHQLDPYKPLNEKAMHVKNKPITIQAISLRWRWLFIYPNQKIATINTVVFPEHTPISFRITSDAPMNSFQIQQLAGQIYAMNGMQTKMHLIADKKGVYRGRSVSFSGNGFANMRFKAHVVSQEAYAAWLKQAKNAPTVLTWKLYKTISGPTKDTSVHYYKLGDQGLFQQVMHKYMGPQNKKQSHQISGVGL